MLYHGGKWEPDSLGPRISWPAKPADTAALAPEDQTVLALLKKYDCECFRVSDGWAVVKDDKSTVISFSAPLSSWEKILQEMVRE